MEGVTILYSFEEAAAWELNKVAFMTPFILMFIVSLCLGIWVYVSGKYSFGIIPTFGVMGVLFGAVLGAGFVSGFRTPTEYEVRYKVTISDQVTMQEFLDKYEILDKEGKIYTVREICKSDAAVAE